MSGTATINALARARHANHDSGVAVSDYVGQPAAEAARAVRRAGLLPGLDRSFGCEPQLTGLVVAQQPVSGEQLARNGMVTLYIAAPGAETQDDGEHQEAERPPTEQATQDASPAPDPLRTFAQTPRHRKRRGARGSEQQEFDVPPAPTVSATDCQIREPGAHADMQPAELNDRPQPQVPAWAAETVEVPEGAEHEPSYEMSLAEEVFAGHASDTARWATAYRGSVTARTWRGALRWVRRHPVLATSVSAMLAVWLAVALTSALAAPRENRANNTLPTPLGAPDRRIGRPPPAGKQAVVRPRRAGIELAPDTHATQRRRPRATRRHSRPIAAPTDASHTAGQVEAPPVRPATAAHPSPPPAPTGAQGGGGPFSP